MMKILLMQPPWFVLQNTSLVHYPVGPAYIAAALEKVGYDPIVWNVDYNPNYVSTIGGTNILNTDELTRNYNIYQKNLNDLSMPIWREVRSKIREFNSDIVGVSVYSATYKSALNLVQIIKDMNPNVITIFGGIHPTISTIEVASQHNVDFVVIGEGEITIQELIRAIEVKSDYSNIKGIAYKKNGKVVITPKREFIANLDDVGLPARHRIYKKEEFPPTAFQAIYGSRGCPFHCIFCGSFNLWGHKPRARSAESLTEEIEYTHKTFKTRYFYICDDVFFLDKERALDFCRILIDKRLKVMWSAQTRAEIIDDELLIMMKKSGGQHVAIGVETGDERIRKLIKKGNTLEQMRRATKLIHKHGLTLVGFFMFGFPWETKQEIEKTIDFMKEINPTFAFPYIVTPAPGTELSQIAHDMGLISFDLKLEDFYHESPVMCLSANIPDDERKGIINNVLKVFAEHNKKKLKLDVFRRPNYYFALAQDYSMFKSPKKILSYIKELLPKSYTGG